MNTLATDLQNSFTDDDDVSVLFMTVSYFSLPVWYEDSSMTYTVL